MKWVNTHEVLTGTELITYTELVNTNIQEGTVEWVVLVRGG